MHLDLTISTLAFLALGSTPAGAQSRTRLSGLHRRDTSDVCANLIELPLQWHPSSGATVMVGLIDTCACLSTIPNVLQTNAVAKALVSVAGTAVATASLTSLINAHGSVCTYPDNAVPVCSGLNACGYSCGNGFGFDSASGDCVCPDPDSICNGQCQSSCPSSVAIPRRRAAAAYNRASERRRMCQRGYTACGITEQRGRATEPWECIDVKADLESCGGCMTPFDAFSPIGVDCTAIRGVADVSCRHGRCLVRRCTSGYAVTSDRSGCGSTRANLVQHY
ncbi:hypothetical protein BD310DRAFT_876522 [Dichomitus squalens]|uniref:Protein CPL1-like domain-containing protein n=1 Tax=Dichomitus squalens TaxID=114155 RepID=A0A4Q9PYF8_9APHY|nr:hypothetical protein BD310DRAFT_876522 [Dichomitus squalens]